MQFLGLYVAQLYTDDTRQEVSVEMLDLYTCDRGEAHGHSET